MFLGFTQSATAIVERNELSLAINLSKGNLTRFEYPKLARFCQTQEEFAEVHGLSQSGKLWKHLSTGDLPESEWLTVFDTPKYKGSKIFLNMVKPQFVDECDSMPGPSMQADVKGRPKSCFMSSVIKKLHAKILDIQSNNKAKVLKNELKEKKAEFLNKRDALIRREATTSAASMIQIEITSLQTRYGILKGANATAEQLAAVEAQIIAMSNAVKLIEGDDKIADMKIAVESIERDVNLLESKLSCFLHYMSFFENMMKQLANGWSDAEAAHHMSFETGRGYTENAVGVEEGNVSNLGIASPGRAEKSWSDRKASKNVGHDTVPPELTVLGATSEEGVEAVLGGNTDAECVFLAEFVKRFKSNKRTSRTVAPGGGPSKKTKFAMQKDADIYLQIDSCTVPSFDSNDGHPKPHACKKL
ncbi:hypothetical protein L7F22_013390 [Adiantum nelumboides]|nr:hypothetical protein [Adiantum nelumboides]